MPTLVLLLTVSGIISTGLATAREWETRSIKELLLAPVSSATVIGGKALAGFVTTFGLGILVIAIAALLGWIHPMGWYWLVTLGIVALVSLFSVGLGIALGAGLQRMTTVTIVGINLALYLFFLAGGIAVIAFEPDWLQRIAAFIPLTYGNHALQLAVFYGSTDQLGRDIVVLLLSVAVTMGAGILALRRRIVG